MGEMINDPDMIRQAARELARTDLRLIKDTIAHAESLRARYGLNFDGRTEARLMCVDMVAEEEIARIPTEVDFEPAIPVNIAILKGVAKILKADIKARATFKKITGRVRVE